MISRAAHVLVLAMLTGVLALAPPATAAVDEAPDTTAPQVHLNPCYDGETTCRRVYAEVYGNLVSGDDLAVLGARIGDHVLGEQVYDDGSGFKPYGWFVPYGNDVAFSVDYALHLAMPLGTSEITVYARDLEGNTSELTTTVLGPIPPGPVKRLRAELSGPRRVTVSWSRVNRHGSCCVRYVISTPGRRTRTNRSGPPSFGHLVTDYRRLSVGWHRFTVLASTEGGDGPASTVRVFVPRRSRS